MIQQISRKGTSAADFQNLIGGAGRGGDHASPAEAKNAVFCIDIVQPTTFGIDSFDQLAQTLDADFGRLINQAKAIGDLPALFEATQAS